MIRINLLPHKKKKRKAAPIEGEKTIGIGMGIVLAFAAGLYLFVHNPQQRDIESQMQASVKVEQDNKKISERIKDFDNLKAAFDSAQKQAASIGELNRARSTPAHFLFELANILKQGGTPSMTSEMIEELEDNENLRWQGWRNKSEAWDPTNVWIESLKESEGEFTLMGAAQSDGDVTQLAHRLNASMYFDNVQPEGSSKKKVKAEGATVYAFRITGKVRY